MLIHSSRVPFLPSLPLLALLGFPAAAQNVSDPFDPANPFPDPIVKGSTKVRLQSVATGLTSPNYLTPAGDGSDRLFVVDQAGSVRLLKNGVLQNDPFLDLKSRLVTLNTRYDERGLLGLAFHPDFATVGAAGHGKLYTYSSEPLAGAADFTVQMPAGTAFNHQAVIAEWQVDPTNPDRVDLATRREILRIDQPQSNHNGGMLSFGPDDLLYIGLGDGGRANDTGNGHGTIGNGQDVNTILGNILRIDPTGNNSANGRYGIPTDNPFVGPAHGLDEIYAYGFRNPWRFSFDALTGRLVVGDVGQNTVEEVDIVTAGGNYGWNVKEGQFAFNPANGTIANDVVLPAIYIDPVLQYDHDEGFSVTGGFVYRGSAIPALQGKYVFGDWGSFGTPSGRLFVGDLDAGTIEEFDIDGAGPGIWILGFGQDAGGELYVLGSRSLGPGGTTGEIFKIAPVPVPPALWLFGSALAGLTGWTRRRKPAGISA